MVKVGTNPTFKVILVGDIGVGKTALVRRLIQENFKSSYVSTIGVDLQSKVLQINGKKIKLQIWDTAGQERFNTITNSYYRGADAVILVYDVQSHPTFENISRWISKIAEYTDENVVKMLVANKCDGARKVSKESGEELARSYGLPFLETSAISGLHVEEMFYNLAKFLLYNKIENCEKKSTIRLGRFRIFKFRRC